MAKEKVNVWDELEGAKDDLTKEIDVKIGETQVSMEVSYMELDEMQEIIDDYEERKTEKPVITVPTSNGQKNIKVPTEDERYQKFNSHKDAKQWLKQNKKYDKRRNYHLAYKYLTEDYRPADNPEDAIEILEDRLRYSDVLGIVRTGHELSGFNEQMGKQKDDS